jgi:hypothetical protein
MKRFPKFLILGAFLALVFLGVSSVEVCADGDEILGPPSIGIEQGTGVIAVGTGLVDSQPGTITIDITDNIKQVLLYWDGRSDIPNLGDNTIIVNGIEVTGTLIGTSDELKNQDQLTVYRADITSLGILGGGSNSIVVDGLTNDVVTYGAGIMVILDDGSAIVPMELRDGQDYAYHASPGRLMTAVPQTFDFPSARFDRSASLAMFFSSVSGAFSGGGDRPSSIEITVGGSTTLISNILDSSDGDEWDTINLDVIIPAGATSLTVEAFSRDDLGTGNNPASFNWIAASLSVPTVDTVACRVTAGGNKKDGFCDSSLQSCVIDGTNTWGGQFGAPPRIAGNWTHHNALSKDDSFVFHSNEMFNVICSDPGDFCRPARFAPNRQIDFMGLGTFNAKKGSYSSLPDSSLCFQVHLEDTGDKGPGGRHTDATEACTHCPGTPIINAADCPSCTDYYMIEIYDSSANDGNSCTGDILYVNGPGVPENCMGASDPQLKGYFTDRGNVQLHPDKNGP